MARLDPAVLDSWLNGALDGDAVSALVGAQGWDQRVRGASFLGHAVLRNRLDLLRDALDQGADPNLADDEGVTPVRMAVFKRRERMFQLLAAWPGLDRTANRTPWSLGDDAPESGRADRTPLFFPSLAFDLARYGTPAMAQAWHAGPDPGWERWAPLETVLDKRGHYHRGEAGHALDAALLHQQTNLAGWLFEHTNLLPSRTVLGHGCTFQPIMRDDPPLSPHPTQIAVRALRALPAGQDAASQRLEQRLAALDRTLQRSKEPWRMGDAVMSLVESWRLHRSTHDLASANESGPRARRRL